MARRYNTRRIKKNQTYSVEELAEAVGATKATVRNWIKDGMMVLDRQRPMLVIGFHAQDYLSKKSAKAKRPLALGELYCLRCKSARMPDGKLADFEPTSESGGRLKAICKVCGCMCNRSIKTAQLADFSKLLDIEIKANT